MQTIEEYWHPLERVDFKNVFKVSAKTNMNIEELCLEFRELIDELEDKSKSNKTNTQTVQNSK